MGKVKKSVPSANCRVAEQCRPCRTEGMSTRSVQEVVKGTFLKLSAKRAFDGLGAKDRGASGDEMS